MIILGIDSSGLACTAAFSDENVLLGEYTVDYKKTHSETLLPMIDALLRQIGIEKRAIGAIACAEGPGSFTGLRIGCATAKGIAMALSIPIVPVSTLAGLAMNVCASDRDIVPIMDARRGQVYGGIYRAAYDESGRPAEPETLFGPAALPMGDLIEKINANGRPVIFLGDGVPVFAEQIAKGVTLPYVFAPAANARQKASSVCELGRIGYAAGRAVAAEDFRPVYLRLSQAERERAEKERAEKERAERERAKEEQTEKERAGKTSPEKEKTPRADGE